MVKKCPICGSESYEILTPLCSNMKILGPHFKDEPANIVCCKKCGLVFVDIEESQEAFNKHYDSEFALTPSYDELYTPEVTKQYFDDWYNEIKDYINYDSYIVDVGGGLGHFAEYLKNKGYKNVHLLDISKTAIESAQKRGIATIFSDSIDFDKKWEHKFDLAMYSNSLEHFYNLDDALKSAKKLMKTDGFLYVELPDADNYVKTNNSPYMLFTLEHLYHFNIKTMENISRIYAFDIVDKKQTLKCGGFNILRTVLKNNNKVLEPFYDSSCKDAIMEYIKFSNDSLKVLDHYKKTQEPIILWGIGASTVILLNKKFDECNVIQLIDRNTVRQGLRYKIGEKEFIIEDPSKVNNPDATIVILPFWYRMSIQKTIASYGFKNKVETLM